MIIPKLPQIKELANITPSIYEASLSCFSKAIWYAFGPQDVIPENPASIIGSSFHSVLAAAHRGELLVAGKSDPDRARQVFDATAQTLCNQAHPLVRLKHTEPARLPFYNMNRERAALIAVGVAQPGLSSAQTSNDGFTRPASPNRTESRLRSIDGLIVGRVDHIEGKAQTIIDYKSGYSDQIKGDVVSDSEARQLCLYAYLAIDNGITISKGAVIRGDGRRCEIDMSLSSINEEADNTRNQLRELNKAINDGAEFDDLATPTSGNCRFCPCIPFCSKFWASADDSWQPECGSHVDGRILEAETVVMSGISITTFLVDIQFGTVQNKHISVEQIPTGWMTLKGSALPEPGARIRVVNGRLSIIDENTATIRADRATTTVWSVPDREGSSHT